MAARGQHECTIRSLRVCENKTTEELKRLANRCGVTTEGSKADICRAIKHPTRENASNLFKLISEIEWQRAKDLESIRLYLQKSPPNTRRGRALSSYQMSLTRSSKPIDSMPAFEKFKTKHDQLREALLVANREALETTPNDRPSAAVAALERLLYFVHYTVDATKSLLPKSLTTQLLLVTAVIAIAIVLLYPTSLLNLSSGIMSWLNKSLQHVATLIREVPAYKKTLRDYMSAGGLSPDKALAEVRQISENITAPSLATKTGGSALQLLKSLKDKVKLSPLSKYSPAAAVAVNPMLDNVTRSVLNKTAAAVQVIKNRKDDGARWISNTLSSRAVRMTGDALDVIGLVLFIISSLIITSWMLEFIRNKFGESYAHHLEDLFNEYDWTNLVRNSA